MPILDLTSAKPLQNAAGKRLFRPGRRDLPLTPGVLAAIQNGGYGAPGGFAAAKYNRLTADMFRGSRSADQDLFQDNRALRGIARGLALNNFAARKYLQMVAQNVVGPNGILMQAKVTGVNGKETAQTRVINRRLEEEWNRWCGLGCTADGRFTFTDVQHLAIKTWAREGETLTKLVYGRQFNDSAIALQMLDNDQLDETFTAPQPDNGEVRLGVEVDQYRKPLGYWLYNGHPNDPVSVRQRNRVRIPADQIIHTAVWERPAQTRGYTQMAASILGLNQYGRYEEAVVVAARASAAKFAVIQQTMAEGWSPDDEDAVGHDRNADGTAVMTANAGEIPVLDPGETLNFTDPRFPTTTHKDFTQTMLRNIASGLLVSYPSLANDLEGVNFSSIRAGLVDERDCWRVLQHWFIDHFIKPVFYKWLKMALLTTLADITLTSSQMRQIGWRARGWEWVDPLKDADSAVLRLGNMLTTYSRELANQGLDFEAVAEERAIEQKYIEDLQDRYKLRAPVTIGTDLAGDQSGKGVAAGATANLNDETQDGGDNAGGKSGGSKQAGGGKGKGA